MKNVGGGGPAAEVPAISTGTLFKNSLWNIAGQGLPLVAAIFLIPVLIHGFGIARFGVLTLAWMLVGYFSLFDLGLGQALTKLVSEKIGNQEQDVVPDLSLTALSAMSVLGLAGALALIVISPWLVSSVLSIPLDLRSETEHAFRILALTIPFTITSVGFVSVLQGHQCFRAINLVRIPLGIWNFLGPAIALEVDSTLVSAVIALAIGRIFAWVCYFYQAGRTIRPHGARISGQLMVALFRFGGWVTLSSIVGPLLVYLDRFLIAAVISVEAVAYFATPSELATKLGVFPSAISSVLLTGLAGIWHSDRVKAAALYKRSIDAIMLALFLPVSIGVAFAREILNFWLGPEFSTQSGFVLQAILVGVWINSLAQMARALILAGGRPNVVALIHLVEFPVYVFGLWWLIKAYGIDGAAIAWLARVTIDAVAMFYFARASLNNSPRGLTVSVACGLVLTVVFLLMIPLAGALHKIALVLGVTVAFAVFFWFFVLPARDRSRIKEKLGYPA